jgi:hypothetical protein
MAGRVRFEILDWLLLLLIFCNNKIRFINESKELFMKALRINIYQIYTEEQSRERIWLQRTRKSKQEPVGTRIHRPYRN